MKIKNIIIALVLIALGAIAYSYYNSKRGKIGKVKDELLVRGAKDKVVKSVEGGVEKAEKKIDEKKR